MEYLLKILRNFDYVLERVDLEYDTLLDRTPIAYLRGTDFGIFQIPFRVAEGDNFETADLGVLLVPA